MNHDIDVKRHELTVSDSLRYRRVHASDACSGRHH